ncbi:cupin domain-containing protein [Streptomyces sp. NPDC102402]|uniref:cupin domain-containing protein n=1 Tax=Streptomyces sp. NPDC102402 TaxID=3366169 RepID=UPI003815CC04
MTEEARTSGRRSGPAVSVVGPGDGETIVLGTTRMRVLEDGRHTGHRLWIAESGLAPRTQGPPRHRHAQHDEGFHVLSGTARFHRRGRGTRRHRGDARDVPPGAPHTFADLTDEPAVMLSTFTPDLYVHYFRDLQEAFADGRTPTRQARTEVMSRYATEPATELT